MDAANGFISNKLMSENDSKPGTISIYDMSISPATALPELDRNTFFCIFLNALSESVFTRCSRVLTEHSTSSSDTF